MSLAERIKKKESLSAIIGCGYVGLPLAVELAKVGLKVVGIDLDKGKVDAINKGKSYIPDVPTEEVAHLVKKGLLSATTDFSILKKADTVNICVPTPLRKTKDPDISYVAAAAEEIAKYLHKGQLIILESTTYPGTTDEVLLPLFEAKGFKVGKDIHLAFSPERVDPGNPVYQTKNTPKVVGGVTPQ
ncbi:MAG: nucleotide sugar dehydrogenase, partial [Nitrospirota bacterium]|nr:nucleotide sugar dehydrogenase [Nitrospirota bacterium]